MRRASAVRVIAASLVLAVGLSMQLASFAGAWNDDCANNILCVFRDRDFGIPRATTSSDVAVYTGNYPGTSSPINDSISSFVVRNYGRDVKFYNEPNYTGAMFCGNSNTNYSWVGLFNNDAWSSHDITNSDSWC